MSNPTDPFIGRLVSLTWPTKQREDSTTFQVMLLRKPIPETVSLVTVFVGGTVPWERGKLDLNNPFLFLREERQSFMLRCIYGLDPDHGLFLFRIHDMSPFILQPVE